MNQAFVLFLVAGLTVCAQDNQSAVQSNLDRMISNARKSVAPASKSPPASPVPADIPMRSAENAPSVASSQVTSGRDTTLITNSVTEQGAGLESLAHGLYYKRRGDEWKKLEITTSTGFRTTHGASSLVGVPPGAVRFFGGSESANQFDNGHPIFGIRVDVARPETPGLSVRDLLIVRVAKKKDLRELEVMGGGFGSVRVGLSSKDVVEGVLTTVADGTFTLIPKSELARGEYLITFRGANGTAGYDFGVRSATFGQSPTKRIFIDPASVAPAPKSPPSPSVPAAMPVSLREKAPSLPATVETLSGDTDLMTDSEVSAAILKATSSRRRRIGLMLQDQQTAWGSAFIPGGHVSGYAIFVYTPEQWIEQQTINAKREMLPFTLADITQEMRRKMLHVVAMPSTPEYLTGTGFAVSSSVHRIVLSDTSRNTIIQPVQLSNGSVTANSALRSAEFANGQAAFMMSDVAKLRASDGKGEFFVVVAGSNQNKYFRVKERFFKALFNQ